MLKFRYAASALASALLTAVGMTGCVTFCDECDDFPVPGRYAALPGTYTGPPVAHGGESRQTDVPDETAKPFSPPGQPQPPTPEQAPPQPNALNFDPSPLAPADAAVTTTAAPASGNLMDELPPLP